MTSLPSSRGYYYWDSLLGAYVYETETFYHTGQIHTTTVVLPPYTEVTTYTTDGKLLKIIVEHENDNEMGKRKRPSS